MKERKCDVYTYPKFSKIHFFYIKNLNMRHVLMFLKSIIMVKITYLCYFSFNIVFILMEYFKLIIYLQMAYFYVDFDSCFSPYIKESKKTLFKQQRILCLKLNPNPIYKKIHLQRYNYRTKKCFK